VSATALFGGDVLIADTSVWLRADSFRDDLKVEWERALINDRIAITPPVAFELIYRARRDPLKFERWRDQLNELRRILIPDHSAWALANEAMAELIETSQAETMSLTDIINATVSMQSGFPVLHVDHDYATLARLDCLTFVERRLPVP
jgi:predicted nucleic acid-binding protein